VIRADKLLVSRPMYAFNPATWQPASVGYVVNAVWFRRKRGVLVASMGHYHPYVTIPHMRPASDSYAAWITAADDNRYGGKHVASWDGQALLCTDQPVTPEAAEKRIAWLDEVLRGFPDPPAGWDGWWTFPRTPAVSR